MSRAMLRPWQWPDGVGLLACLAAAAGLSVLLRQDANWDLQNYHLYNGWALLTGRFGQDLFVSGIQSYLNPLLDVPYAAAALLWFPAQPRLVAALAGLPAGLLAWLVCRTSGATAGAVGAGPGPTAWMAVIGLSGSTVVSEIGTSFNDIPVGCLAVAAVWVVLRGVAGRTAPLCAAACAGALLGLAAGLKITMIVLAPAGLAMVLAAGPPDRRVVAFGAAWVAGVLLADGWWALLLWQRFGNPVFPLLNGVFASPWHAADNGQDLRFLPRTALQTVFFPFRFLGKQEGVASELAMRDGRFALAWIAVLGLGVLALRRRLPRAGAVTAIVFAVGFVAWEAVFGIIRYLVPLEALVGVPVGLALWLGLPGVTPRWRTVLLGVIAGLLIATTNYPGWGRVRGWRARVIDVAGLPIAADTLVVVEGKPLSFLLPGLLGPGNAALGLEDVLPGTGLEQEIRARIAAAPAVYALRHDGSDDARLRRFGVRSVADSCRAVVNNLRPGVVLCRTAKL